MQNQGRIILFAGTLVLLLEWKRKEKTSGASTGGAQFILFTDSSCSVAKQQEGYKHGGQRNRNVVIYNISYRNTFHHSSRQRNEKQFTKRLIPADLNVTKPREVEQHPATMKQTEYINNTCESLPKTT
jgi:hypothetical protein